MENKDLTVSKGVETQSIDSSGSSEDNNIMDDSNYEDRYLKCLLESKKRGYILHRNPSSAQNRYFYECVAESTGKTVEDVIHLITQYMLQNRYIPKTDDGEEDEDLLLLLSDADFPHLPGRPETWHECITALLQGQMANSVVIRSTASFFSVNINVIDWTGSLTEIAPFHNKAEKSVFLAYTGMHYMLLKSDESELGSDDVDGAPSLHFTGLEKFQSMPLNRFHDDSSPSSSQSVKVKRAADIEDNYQYSQKGNKIEKSSDGLNGKKQQKDDGKFAALERQFSRLNIPGDLNDQGILEATSLKNAYEVLKKEKKYLRRMLEYYENVPRQMAGFIDPFNCAVSCGLRCVLFVFFKMGLQVCNKKFINMFPDVGNCSLGLDYFFNIVRLLVAGPKEKSFCRQITEDYNLDRALQEAVAVCMPGESHPALLVMEPKRRKDSKRAGHCIAIMPNGQFVDVQKKRYWKPNGSEKNSIGRIYVVKVDKRVAEGWVKKCGLNICNEERYYYSKTDFPGCTDDLN